MKKKEGERQHQIQNSSCKCCLCHSEVEKILFDWGNNPVMKCEKCGLVFRKIAVELSEEELFRFAETMGDKSKGTTFRNASYGEDDSKVISWRSFFNEKALERFKTCEGRKLIDIGSATGVFLDIAGKNGWKPIGIEPSENFASHAREVFELPVFTKTLEEANLPSNEFDVATMWDVIEHLKNPAQTVAEAFRILKPGGMLFVYTPNHDSSITHISHLLYRLSLRKFPLERLLYPVVHLYFFTPKTLSYLLLRCGFNIERVGSGSLRSETSLQSTKIVRIGASVIDLVSKLLGKRYRMVVFASKPFDQGDE